MSDKCGNCDLEISQMKDGLKCPDCNIMFHLKCLNPGYAKSGKKVTRKNAKCYGCVSDTSSTASQHTGTNNILITGVPVTPQEECLAILDSIARALDIPFRIPDISVAHRLSSREGDSRPPVIVVSFVSRAVKAVWLEVRRTVKKLSARDLHQSFIDHQCGPVTDEFSGRNMKGGKPFASYINKIWMN
ncbi:hypothetical protein J6590_082631 [Homalodisca vitripennis]|nr:hypothetical protein J6590_082631 [Homalodisca vitripennis]